MVDIKHEMKITGVIRNDAVYYPSSKKNRTKFTIVVKREPPRWNLSCNCLLWEEMADKYQDLRAGTEVEALVAYHQSDIFSSSKKRPSVNFHLEAFRIVGEAWVESKPAPAPVVEPDDSFDNSFL